MNRYLAEFIGTFALVFTGTGAIVINDLNDSVIAHAGIAATFGLVVTAMIYSLGDVSGAHINPAVSIAFGAGGQLERRHVVPYVFSQICGALLASGLLRLMFPEHPNLGATLPAGTVVQAFTFEVILTFLLMFVILNVTAATSVDKTVMAGAAIGGTVALEAMFAGPICGASMNPARSIGPALMSFQLTHLWIYLVAPVIGALLAIPATRCIRPDAEDGDPGEEMNP